MGALLNFTATLEDVGECCVCGVRFAIPSNLLAALRQNKQIFFCPSGHPQSFRTSDVDRLRGELERAQAERNRANELRFASQKEAESARLQERLVRGKLKAIKVRVKNGVCPCCNRSFVQLARHMATKHPGFEDADE